MFNFWTFSPAYFRTSKFGYFRIYWWLWLYVNNKKFFFVYFSSHFHQCFIYWPTELFTSSNIAGSFSHKKVCQKRFNMVKIDKKLLQIFLEFSNSICQKRCKKALTREAQMAEKLPKWLKWLKSLDFKTFSVALLEIHEPIVLMVNAKGVSRLKIDFFFGCA